MHAVGLFNAKTHFSESVLWAAAKVLFVVTRRNKPVSEIVPLHVKPVAPAQVIGKFLQLTLNTGQLGGARSQCDLRGILTGPEDFVLFKSGVPVGTPQNRLGANASHSHEPLQDFDRPNDGPADQHRIRPRRNRASPFF